MLVGEVGLGEKVVIYGKWLNMTTTLLLLGWGERVWDWTNDDL